MTNYIKTLFIIFIIAFLIINALVLKMMNECVNANQHIAFEIIKSNRLLTEIVYNTNYTANFLSDLSIGKKKISKVKR